jgi:hypothetical protein
VHLVPHLGLSLCFIEAMAQLPGPPIKSRNYDKFPDRRLSQGYHKATALWGGAHGASCGAIGDEWH